MNRARVEIDLQFKVLRWQAVAAVYDLDDGTRHVDVAELKVNGALVEFDNATPKVKAQLREALIEKAEAEEA